MIDARFKLASSDYSLETEREIALFPQLAD